MSSILWFAPLAVAAFAMWLIMTGLHDLQTALWEARRERIFEASRKRAEAHSPSAATAAEPAAAAAAGPISSDSLPLGEALIAAPRSAVVLARNRLAMGTTIFVVFGLLALVASPLSAGLWS